ncbi:MAG: NlpC/P60 family protein [Porcincola intestinalis]|uniref:NlpC/P60 family protein n=1 Tax=Porcincola intestinalis TaxID=2606632 RepID=UPI002A91C36F|nr:NlpC/P60 family protein [Porcincola intestinalis]MDY5332609.1 NlpC/P60 family protein [Porcincola intestinalis]
MDRANSRVLQSAALRTAYLERESSEAYGQILKSAGFSSDGQKAAAQLAYEKQVRKALKGEYRKQLTEKISKLNVSSLAKKAQMQKFRQEQMQEDEQSRAMTQQAEQSFGLMAKGTKALRKVADDARKAIRALVRKKLVILIIPLILVLILPFLMMFIPILGTATATSYEDNEVYAYADATELIEYAKQWIGKIPYVWGGGHGGSPTAWQSGCDCSGFVHGVFNHFGYEIGGDTGAMETQAGTHIAYDSLVQAKPGDVLIYYRTGTHIKGQPNGNGSTHVSIYIGNNQIIHQSGGVHISNEYHQYFEVRRVLTPDVGGRGNISGGLGGMGTYGHKTDATNYSQSDLELIWAIVAQEDNGSYRGALAVISSAMNRVESPTWSYEGSNALAQLTAPGQYCYSNDTYWQARLGGNVPDYVKQAVNDCLKKGKRNHSYTSFRSTKGKTTGADAVQIGGNWFFGH